MPPITAWKPATQISRGNVSVGLAPAIANIEAPTLAELTATGTQLECSIQTFNGTSSADSETIDWLCDPASEQLPGSTTHSIDDLVIKSTGQADATLISALKIGQTLYIWRRDGMAVATAPAAGQFIWVWKVIVTSIDPLEANNTFVGITAHINVLARSKTAVALA
jgi:hypothetical protein